MTAEASRADEIVARARAWIGTPYRHQASCRGAGTDCLGLLRGVWREVLGPEPEAVPSYTPDWSEPSRSRGPAGGGRAAPAFRSRPADALPGDVLVLRMRDGGVAKHVGIPGAVAARARDADPCLLRAWRGRIAADAGLGAADRRGLPFSRQEVVMATLLLAAAGSALGGAARRIDRRHRAHGARQGGGRDRRLGARPAAARARLGAGGDRARRALPRDGVERGRAAGARLRAQPGGRAGDLVEPVPRVASTREEVGGKGGGGAPCASTATR